MGAISLKFCSGFHQSPYSGLHTQFNNTQLTEGRIIKGRRKSLCTGKLFFLFLNENKWCGYSHHMFSLRNKKNNFPVHKLLLLEHPKHMFKLMDK